ncbi:MAG: hypothetical protein RIQ79_500, partial [Verrucomicrobiota bacterium]
FTLNDGSAPIATTTGGLTLSGNTTVTIIGTPLPSTAYTLLSAASVSGTAPTLTANVTGYSLVIESNSLKLKPDAVGDATAPAQPSVTLLAASDTGASGTDGITKATTPTLRVTLAGSGDTAPVVGDVVKLYNGATQVASASLGAGDITAGYVDLTTGVLTPGSLSFTATVTDAASNVSNASTALGVTLDTTPPVITLIGSASTSAVWGTAYTDAGATSTDNIDGGPVSVTGTGSVNTATPGAYIVNYNATDVAGNSAIQVVRTVTVSIPNSTTVGADGYTPLMKYALGATSPSGTVQAPVTSATSTTLSITAVVRNDDPKLTVSAESSTDLTAGFAGSIAGSLAGDQSNLPAGCERRVYTATIAGSKTFLRLKAVLAP